MDSCRICLGDSSEGRFISPCKCKGSIRFVHAHCLEKWRNSSINPKSYWECDQCKYKYSFRRTFVATMLRNEFIVHLLTILFFLVCSLVLGVIISPFYTIKQVFTSYSDLVMFYTFIGAIFTSFIGFISLLCSLLFSIGFATGITFPDISHSSKETNTLITIICIVLGFCYIFYHTYQLVSYLTTFCISKTEYLIENV